ncbi:amidohydrolase family protein [Chloroflexota bacterium]
MKIDVFSHILPEKYLAAYQKKARASDSINEARNRANCEIEMRLRIMDRYPDVLQVLSVSLPPLETQVNPKDAIELSRLANDELAELLNKYPDKFLTAVACLPLNDIDAALEEADRAITQLRFRGVQIFSNINGESPGLAKFKPLYEKMAYYDLPLWIHPWFDRENQPGSLVRFDQETTWAMWELVAAGIFLDYPGIKFITHHCGGIVSLFDGRIGAMQPVLHSEGRVINTLEHLRKFYGDTACSGSTAALMCGYEFLGVDKMLFATDAPLGAPYGLTAETIRSVEKMSIPDDEKEQIFERNAVKLLRLAI